MRIIDGDAFVDKFSHIPMVQDALRKAVDSMPTVDAVPVVRCGQCNFWDRDHISCEGLAKCCTGEGGIRYRNRSDFCSRGEREEQ